MSDAKTGGPAFPGYGEPGMTLRDYFAAKAMQGFISRGGHYECAFDAARAYAFADAMLKAREE
jgi:hypothetical protein